MLRIMIGGSIAALAAAAAVSASAAVITDSGFETQAGGVTSYCYFGFAAGGNAACGPGAWTGADGGGFQDEGNGPWPGEPTPDGSKYAFIQNTGWLEQSFTAATAGTYLFTWLDAGRPAGCCGGNQSYNVLMDNVIFASYSTTTDQPFGARSAYVTLTAGTHLLRFQGLNNAGDQTALLDDVQGAVVPEPGTWALMILGFGAAGAMLRKRTVLAV